MFSNLLVTTKASTLQTGLYHMTTHRVQREDTSFPIDVPHKIVVGTR